MPLPLWRRVDPLAVLALSDDERREVQETLRAAKAAEDKSSSVGRLLEDKDPDPDDRSSEVAGQGS